MSVLVPFLPFDPSETPMSFATRLASLHLGWRVVPFLRDLGIRPEALAGGEIEAVEQLAAIADVESAALQWNSASRIAKRRFNLRGHELTAEFFASPETAFCPACLIEDDKVHSEPATVRRGRLEWALRPVYTCPIHGLALQHRSKQRWDDQFRELACIIPERGDALDRLLAETEQRAASSLQNYVLGRLDGASGPEWLDGQTIEQTVRATEMLGMRIQYGASKKPSEMTRDEWDAAGRAGYEVTSEGEPAIRDALSQMQAEYSAATGKPGCRKIFGPFYEWLASNKNSKDAGDITRILREHIIDTMDFAGGRTVLGFQLEDRKLHSVRSLALEADLDARTLRNVLAAQGVIPVERSDAGQHTFDAEKGRAVAASIQRLIHMNALDGALGCTRPQKGQLLDERLLTAMSDGLNSAVGRTWKGVPVQEVEDFLLALEQSARLVDTVPCGMVSIAKAAEKAKLLSVEIVHLILGGFLENVARLRDGFGYSAIFVDPEEVRVQARTTLVGMCGISAFSRLRIPKATGWALVDRLEGPRLDAVVIEGRTCDHRIHRFTEKTVAAFMSNFTTVARLATDYSVEQKLVFSHLKRARIQPAIKASDAGVNFYRIAEIPDIELVQVPAFENSV